MDVTRERCQKIIDAGAQVILTTKGIDDFAQKYFVEHGIMALRRVEKDDMRRIARASGGSIVLSMATEGGEESFSVSPGREELLLFLPLKHLHQRRLRFESPIRS